MRSGQRLQARRLFLRCPRRLISRKLKIWVFCRVKCRQKAHCLVSAPARHLARPEIPVYEFIAIVDEFGHFGDVGRLWLWRRAFDPLDVVGVTMSDAVPERYFPYRSQSSRRTVTSLSLRQRASTAAKGAVGMNSMKSPASSPGLTNSTHNLCSLACLTSSASLCRVSWLVAGRLHSVPCARRQCPHSENLGRFGKTNAIRTPLRANLKGPPRQAGEGVRLLRASAYAGASPGKMVLRLLRPEVGATLGRYSALSALGLDHLVEHIKRV